MPQVEKTSGGMVYLRDLGQRARLGDQLDVPESTAEYLVDERGDFEYVRDIERKAAEVTEALVDESASDEQSDEDDFSVDEFLDRDYQDRADAVRAGGVDDHLDAIEDAERSDTVLDAIDDRRTELAQED